MNTTYVNIAYSNMYSLFRFTYIQVYAEKEHCTHKRHQNHAALGAGCTIVLFSILILLLRCPECVHCVEVIFFKKHFMTAGSTSRMMAITVHGLHTELKLMQKIGG